MKRRRAGSADTGDITIARPHGLDAVPSKGSVGVKRDIYEYLLLFKRTRNKNPQPPGGQPARLYDYLVN